MAPGNGTQQAWDAASETHILQKLSRIRTRAGVSVEGPGGLQGLAALAPQPVVCGHCATSSQLWSFLRVSVCCHHPGLCCWGLGAGGWRGPCPVLGLLTAPASLSLSSPSSRRASEVSLGLWEGEATRRLVNQATYSGQGWSHLWTPGRAHQEPAAPGRGSACSGRHLHGGGEDGEGAC